ncbi:MAG: hypothetical protein A2X25_08510 [Chloroflexi bacterium GWB2_49_20]|nr:MAG: hypothetical protein A2X25_08510 [Chloroflexi bacterium GWB2_49_20]OGN79523.1 MAG: hypothetical protein A2X26_05515 [Chloroflexi bacterium GWC2_49_37]OGN84554.1 MAG: hypothetical protein A2X27_11015 [Chloroflexi bacterium GWD2_49_16]HBG74022.1 DUF4126 domain-containing protein [Anaerolineae bacterium]HCC78824.1 DUF4126 domain-containing protein [Anaerolineae bacterium]
MDILSGILSAFGLSASAGLNAYIPLLVIGVTAHYTDLIKLNSPWDTLANPWILILLGVLVIIEMVADKIPAVNHINDIIQSVVRPVAGAIVFAASARVVSDIHPIVAMACGLLIAGSVHIVKAAAIRPAVTVTTGGTANVPVSIAEDILATFTSLLSVLIPILVGVFICIVAAVIIWWFISRTNKHKLV